MKPEEQWEKEVLVTGYDDWKKRCLVESEAREALYEKAHTTIGLSESLPRPKGFWWWQRCPFCGGHIKAEHVSVYVLWTCHSCPYEKAEYEISY